MIQPLPMTRASELDMRPLKERVLSRREILGAQPPVEAQLRESRELTVHESKIDCQHPMRDFPGGEVLW